MAGVFRFILKMGINWMGVYFIFFKMMDSNK